MKVSTKSLLSLALALPAFALTLAEAQLRARQPRNLAVSTAGSCIPINTTAAATLAFTGSTNYGDNMSFRAGAIPSSSGDAFGGQSFGSIVITGTTTTTTTSATTGSLNFIGYGQAASMSFTETTVQGQPNQVNMTGVLNLSFAEVATIIQQFAGNVNGTTPYTYDTGAAPGFYLNPVNNPLSPTYAAGASACVSGMAFDVQWSQSGLISGPVYLYINNSTTQGVALQI